MATANNNSAADKIPIAQAPNIIGITINPNNEAIAANPNKAIAALPKDYQFISLNINKAAPITHNAPANINIANEPTRIGPTI